MNIAEILKDYPKGTKLYSPLIGEVRLQKVDIYNEDYPIQIKGKNDYNTYEFTSEGKYFISHPDGECILFPSKDIRDWSAFKVQKKEYQFKPFDKVLVRNREDQYWKCSFFSNIIENNMFCCCGILWKYCIPYKGNQELVGTCNGPKCK